MHRRLPSCTPLLLGTLLLAAIVLAAPALAQAGTAGDTLRIGVVLDQTGPSSALGVGEADTLELLRQQYADQGGRVGPNVEFTLIDSASTVAGALGAVQRLLSQDQVHALICCTRSSSSQAIIAPAQAAGVPTISLAAAAPIARPAAQRRWIFQAAQSDSLMIQGIVADMKRLSVTDASLMVLADEFGQSGLMELQQELANSGITIDTVVHYGAADESYVAATLAAVLNRPQAVVVWGIAEDSARMVRALRDRSFGGYIYVSHGVGAPVFLEMAGAAAEGVRLPIGPALVAEQLATNNPSRAAALDYSRAYTQAYGADNLSSFGAHLYDAVKLIDAAVAFAEQQGTLDLADLSGSRSAIRSALEAMGPYQGAGGVFDYSGSDHAGLDGRAMVMVEVRDGSWRLAD